MSNVITLQIPAVEALPKAADDFLAALGAPPLSGHTVFAFRAPMGAGKTTLIKAICEALGVTDTVNSPTFAIVNEYEATDLSPLRERVPSLIYHFDCYRIKTLTEALDFGFEDYMESGSLCFIEWPENVEPLLPADTVEVCISVNADNSRTVTLQTD